MTDMFLNQMKQFLGPSGVLLGDDVTSRSCDPLKVVSTTAKAILRPKTTSEVCEVVRSAARHNVAIVVHGGRTGVSGGAYAEPEEIVISLERMNEIEAVDAVNQTIVAQAGVTLQQLQEAAAAEGMYYPVDLGARGTATVGGTLATNAGGNRTLRWGMTRDRVMGLEVVLPDGELVSSMHRLIKNNTGYDLKHLFIGAEGTLGIITKAVFRLVPAPTSHEVVLMALPDYDSVLTTLNAAQKLSSLSAFELMYGSFYDAVASEKQDSLPLPPGQPYYVLIEIMGYNPDQDRDIFETFLSGLYERMPFIEIVLAQSEAQRAAIWGVRESIEAAVKTILPCMTYDVSLEVGDIDDYVRGLESVLGRYPHAKMIVNGHIGDNNIHLGVSIGPETLQRADEVNDIVYRPLVRYQGSMSAEHGIGTTKNEYLHITRSNEEVELMRRIKQVIDPHNRMNRRVIFPVEQN